MLTRNLITLEEASYIRSSSFLPPPSVSLLLPLSCLLAVKFIFITVSSFSSFSFFSLLVNVVFKLEVDFD